MQRPSRRAAATRTVLLALAATLATFGFAPIARADDATAACFAPRACDGGLPVAFHREHFHHFRTRLQMDGAAARHRGYDDFIREGEPQWAMATFSYGVPGRALQGEDVDVWLMRDCARWEHLGTATTSGHGTTVRLPDGAIADPGRVAFRIPDAQRLGPGMHRVRFVVKGDGSFADTILNVVPRGAHIVVSDVDGTLTESESSNFWFEFGLHAVPAANPGAASVLQSLAHRGYDVFYLTGRPDWTHAQTHAWLRAHGFPEGVLRTRAGLGIGGQPVTDYKLEQLRKLVATIGRAPDYGFGNTMTDVIAYRAAGIEPSHRFFYRYTGERAGGVRQDDYRGLVGAMERVAAVCDVAPRTNVASVPAARPGA